MIEYLRIVTIVSYPSHNTLWRDIWAIVNSLFTTFLFIRHTEILLLISA